MTTGIYKKGKYIAADKRWTWWHVWIDDTNVKILKIFRELTDYDEAIYIVTSGPKIIPWMLKTSIGKIISNPEFTHDEKLYEIQSRLKQICPTDFEFIIIFIHYKKDTAFIIKEQWYRFIPTEVSLIADFCSVGSWSYYVDWMHLLNPNLDLKQVFELVSSKDVYTSKEFDLIDLT